MGNNGAFTSFEASVMAVYNRGLLDKSLLADLAEPYRGVDIDSGGKMGTLSKDGLEIEDVVLKVWTGEVPERPLLPADYKTWTAEQEEENEVYNDKRFGAFLKIVREEFGWG